MKKKITITIEDVEEDNCAPSNALPYDENDLVIQPGSYYWERQSKNTKSEDNGWVNGIDICANCPDRPGGPNNKSGFACVPFRQCMVRIELLSEQGIDNESQGIERDVEWC